MGKVNNPIQNNLVAVLVLTMQVSAADNSQVGQGFRVHHLFVFQWFLWQNR